MKSMQQARTILPTQTRERRKRQARCRSSLGQLRCGLRFRFGHHAGQRNWRAALALAFIRRFHEREDFNRLLGADRRFACFEKLSYLAAKLLVASASAG